MNTILPNELLNMIYKNKNTSEISPEEKKEEELNLDDRMHLMSKQIDNNVIHNIYDGLCKRKNLIYQDNLVEINDYVFNDVELLHDYYLNENNSLFDKLNKCHTKIGSLLLKNILLKPVYDQKILLSRQNYLNKINNIKDQLIPIMKNIKSIENDLIWFWNDGNMKHIDLMKDMIYFNWDIIPFFNVGDALNKNEKALLITNIYKIVISPLLTCLTPIISLLVPLILMLYFNKKVGNALSWKQIIINYFKTLWNNDTMKFLIQNPTKANLASLATKGLYLFMYFQNIYYSIQSSSNTNKIINIIHEKLNKMTLYIKYSKQIEKICTKNGLDNISSYLHYNNVKEDNELYYLNYFCFPVFEKEPGLFTNKGKILKTFSDFRHNKDILLNVFHYNGIIDVLLSTNNLLNNSSESHPYTKTSYLDSSVPKINIENIWHPFLDKNVTNNVVKNNIKIHKNLLITGPNAAGKSTFIKSVIINIILAQTIGINSCTKFELSPFHLLETFLNIPDIKGTSSLFEAEMIRSKDYIEKISNIEEDKFSFIVLDEIFSSTNYVEGFSGAYSILKKLSTYENALFIVTTHYTDLEILEKDTNGKIKNYKFEISYNENKDIIFNYLIKEGISRQYIALELLEKNGFSDDIIIDAKNICSKIKNNKIHFIKKNDNKKKKKEKKEKIISKNEKNKD